MNRIDNLTKGFIKENPLFVSVLGMCPSLAVTTSLENALGMGIGVFFVLTLSNFIVSLVMSNKTLADLVRPVRIPVYIVIIATLVTVVEMLMHAFLIDLYKSLGVFIPLIVVNCIILGRAEAFASENKPLDSVLDGIGMALGFTGAIALISIFREFLGAGTITVWGDFGLNLTFIFNFLHMEPIGLFIQPVGAFLSFGLILATLTAIGNKNKERIAAREATVNG